MATKKTSPADRIEQLLEDAKSTNNKALNNALNRHAEEENKKHEEKLLKYFKVGQLALDGFITDLRKVRKKEKEVKKKLEIVDKAFSSFKETGDYEKFKIELDKVGFYIQHVLETIVK